MNGRCRTAAARRPEPWPGPHHGRRQQRFDNTAAQQASHSGATTPFQVIAYRGHHAAPLRARRGGGDCKL